MATLKTFKYRAKDRQGQMVSGEMQAGSESAVQYQLSLNHLVPIFIQEQSKSANVAEFFLENFGIGLPSLQELIVFSRQMHTLTRSGVPLIKSLNVISSATRNEALKKSLIAVNEAVQGGATLSSAFQKYPLLFPSIVVSLVQVGETTGALEDAFLQISFYLETEDATKKRIKTAIRYPSFVLIVISLAIMVINVFVIPSFKGFFSKFGADLPLPTRILIATSDFTIQYWYLLLIGLIGFITLFSMYIKTPAGRLAWDRRVLKLPIIGIILEKALLARFSRAFAMTMKSGVPVLQALGVIANAVGNRFVSSRILLMRTGLERGESLLAAAQNSHIFTPLVLQMLSIGEETGDVDGMITQVAVYYEEEVDYELKRLSDVIEPVLIVIIAGVVLVLALGVFLPMWDLSRVALQKMHR